jgi:hypothetical protein
MSATYRIEILDSDPPLVALVKGRDHWALCEMVNAGEHGCTPIERVGPRWSAYVFNLRRLGLIIETIREAHGGTYAGHHARYVLRSRVRFLDGSAVGMAA